MYITPRDEFRNEEFETISKNCVFARQRFLESWDSALIADSFVVLKSFSTIF
jgi:hypothetical protein